MTSSSIVDIRSALCPHCGQSDAMVIIRTEVSVLHRCCMCGDESTTRSIPAVHAAARDR